MADFVCVRHAETGNYWQCPAAVLDAMRAKGWELAEAPEERDPATVARERDQSAAAEQVPGETAGTEAADTAEPTTEPAARGKAKELNTNG